MAVPHKQEEELIAAIRVARSERVGAVTFRKLIELFGSGTEALRQLPMMAARSKSAIVICDEARAQKERQHIKDHDASVFVYGAADYPPLLAELDDPPSVVTVRGHHHLLQQKCVAMVGTRNASAHARLWTRQCSEALTQAGYVVVSGLARGIDTAAHQGALQGGTVAVMAGGVDHIYPPENEELYHDIMAVGAIISEMPWGTMPRPQLFPRRNRVVSGLSVGVVVVEAPLRSGSLITAQCAAEQGREVFAIPGAPSDPRSKGPNKLLKDGAHLVESSQEIIDILEGEMTSLTEQKSQPPAKPQPLPDETELHQLRDIIMHLLSVTPIGVDELIRESGASYQAVTYVLVQLELEGAVRYHAGNKVSLVS